MIATETPAQKVFINSVYRQLIGRDGTLRKDVRYMDVYGGRRSAKSYDVCQILGLTALKEPGHLIVPLRKVGNTIKDSVFAEVTSFFREKGVPTLENKTDKEVTLPNGSRFRCLGLDDPEKLKSLKGVTIYWPEEANELLESDLDSIDAGLSPSNYPGRIVLTHNPTPQIPGAEHWLKKRFLNIEHELGVAKVHNTPTGAALILRTWYKHNAKCPAETIRVLEGYKTSNPEKYKMWALGEYTKLEGLVFDNWDIVHAVPPNVDFLGYGVDFGFSVDPATCLGVWMHNDEIWLKGFVYKTGLSNSMLFSEMRAAGVDWKDPITPDSAEPKSVEDMRTFGFRCVRPVHKKANYKEDLINRVRSFKIHLVEGDVDLVREFSTYSWARDRMGKQLPKLQDGDDHYVDAFIMRMHDYYQARGLKAGKVSAAMLGF